MKKVLIFIFSFVSIFGIVNCLTCISSSNSDHVTCSRYDYCLYLSGTTDEGGYVKYQGCSEDFDAEYDTDTTTCTDNEYTRQVDHGNTDILQCCDTNNCNTGKEGGNGANQIYTVFSLIMIFCCSVIFMPF